MYDHILYPTDGSEAAEVVEKHVKSLADAYDARIHILYVVDSDHNKSSMTLQRDQHGNWTTGMFRRDSDGNRGGMSKDKIDVLELLEREGTELIQEIAGELSQQEGYKTATACKRGRPHKVITSYAADNDIDLIVMGTHGRSGLSRQLIGSVTEKVIRTADTPVLTARQ
ncbi:universal stress protein [Halohasta litorea]|uniref:Universal stress protein n=1 Tax=Halohasta litorea TaxID=869891 RepID=A0ABD6D4A0_9EURY|nr:universal stress protein [Halohasta litorea]MEA1932153.1 universal stress protein [Euryarchaeota archaeon]